MFDRKKLGLEGLNNSEIYIKRELVLLLKLSKYLGKERIQYQIFGKHVNMKFIRYMSIILYSIVQYYKE